ncbi:MAG: hydroxyacid dehydrogenase [Trueperaceae bacterium]|nr:hydroxyacid dehydrogenase [Trueperaceae bacterium]
MATVVVSEWIDGAALERIAARHELVYDPQLHADVPALHAALADADAWVVRNQSRVDRAALAVAPGLRVVGRVGVGLDNLDLTALRERGVAVTWAPGTNAASVAEYVLGALVHLWRRFDGATEHVRGGGWDRPAFMGREAFGRTLGLIGLGDIGARVARRARAFGLEVVASDPALHDASFAVQELGVALLPVDELLARSDAVSLHVPLVPGTRGLIDAEALARMRPDALLVNTSRGGLIDEAALATALREGRLGGAALDVRDHEPPGDGDPLAGAPRLLLTPHVAGVTVESNARASRHVADEVLRALAGEGLRTPVR